MSGRCYKHHQNPGGGRRAAEAGGACCVLKREGTVLGETLTCPQLNVDCAPVETAGSALSRRVVAERGNSRHRQQQGDAEFTRDIYRVCLRLRRAVAGVFHLQPQVGEETLGASFAPAGVCGFPPARVRAAAPSVRVSPAGTRAPRSFQPGGADQRDLAAQGHRWGPCGSGTSSPAPPPTGQRCTRIRGGEPARRASAPPEGFLPLL